MYLHVCTVCMHKGMNACTVQVKVKYASMRVCIHANRHVCKSMNIYMYGYVCRCVHMYIGINACICIYSMYVRIYE